MSYLVCLYQGPYATTTVTARLVKQQLFTCITRDKVKLDTRNVACDHVLPGMSLSGTLRNDDGDGKICTCITRVSHVYHAFLYIFLPSLHENDAVKLPNFKFCEGHEHKATTSFFFSWNLIQSLEFNYRKKIVIIWRIKRDGISAIKFKLKQCNFTFYFNLFSQFRLRDVLKEICLLSFHKLCRHTHVDRMTIEINSSLG